MSARLPLLGILLFVGLWQAVVTLADLPRFILPGPLLVLEAMWTNKELIAEHALVTLAEVPDRDCTRRGSWFAQLQFTWPIRLRPEGLSAPILVFSQAIPVFALAPILTLWLGYGLMSKVAMAVLIIYFPVDVIILRRGSWQDATRVPGPCGTQWGPDRRRQLLLVRIPSAMPSLATGLRLGAVYAPIGAVIGEWVGASRGLGYLMLLANGPRQD